LACPGRSDTKQECNLEKLATLATGTGADSDISDDKYNATALRRPDVFGGAHLVGLGFAIETREAVK
jgi:hypothetical protein